METYGAYFAEHTGEAVEISGKALLVPQLESIGERSCGGNFLAAIERSVALVEADMMRAKLLQLGLFEGAKTWPTFLIIQGMMAENDCARRATFNFAGNDGIENAFP